MIAGITESSTVYGGHFIALAIKAATETVKPSQYMHSFQCHMLLAGAFLLYAAL